MDFVQGLILFVIGGGLFYLICMVEKFIVDKSNEEKIREPKGGLSLVNIFIVILGGLLAILTVYTFGNYLEAGTYFMFLWFMVAVTLVDIDIMEIPDSFVIGVGLLGILSIFTVGDISLVSRLIGVFAISLPLFLITLLVDGAFGGGDIKLMAAAGFFLGWEMTLLAGFIGIIIGGIYGAILLISKAKSGKEHFAFGPCLCLGMALCCFFGDQLIDIYFRIFDLTNLF